MTTSWLIPAWAGKTSACRGFRGAAAGSSPRGRGKLAGGSAETYKQGLIPAWAGKTPTRHPRSSGCSAHPRVGGENHDPRRDRPLMPGSSPRGRGKRERPGRVPTPGGLIPAWAGKTISSVPASARQRAHPRVGGENPWTVCPKSNAAGSSPRGRGKRGLLCRYAHERGLIPAWAGKTRGYNHPY